MQPEATNQPILTRRRRLEIGEPLIELQARDRRSRSVPSVINKVRTNIIETSSNENSVFGNSQDSLSWEDLGTFRFGQNTGSTLRDEPLWSGAQDNDLIYSIHGHNSELPISIIGNLSKKVENMADTKIAHEGTIIHAEMLYEDELEPLLSSFNDNTIKYISSVSDEANMCKQGLMRAMVYLQTNDKDHYEKNFKDRAVTVKNKVLNFLKKTQKYLRSESESTGTNGSSVTVTQEKEKKCHSKNKIR